MKRSEMLLFLIIVIVIYTAVNYYLFRTAKLFLPKHVNIFAIIFWFLVIAFPLGQLLERIFPSVLSDALVWVGNFYLGAMVYGLILALIFSLYQLLAVIFPSFKINFTDIQRYTIFWSNFLLIVFIEIIGFYNSEHPHLKEFRMKMDISRPLNLVFVSDIHLGSSSSRMRTQRIVELIQSEKPDIIVLGGDIFDGDIQPVKRQHKAEPIFQLKAPLGVYAVTGNHEYIGGGLASKNYLKTNGIRLLEDESVLVDSLFYLIGREDRDKERFGMGQRKTIEELTHSLNQSFPKILIDHQPYELDKKAKAGIDLTLSGHTHNGQLWPFNYITGWIYEVGYGFLRKGNTLIYVSCGAGTWGPPIRTNSRPEVVHFEIIPSDTDHE